ncbi:UvrD-helicase domain-containing protein [Azovibrio restrictus]|uniref:UvrD-helicase domain-containing protein n=1 Tax=Azovibrio restrictus TaxID=146938 RepID=UPI0026EFDD7E|nr:UvrD-helicase domain-containing protein [Azovibrio restrictus]
MATFIPERVGASSARSIHIKRTLNALDDEHVVRTPIRRGEWLPDFFVQHRENGWLAIAVADTPFSALAGDQLFGNEERAAFEKLLADFQTFPAIPDAGREPLGKLILLWKCKADEVRTVAGQYLARFGIRLLSRDQFQELGAKLVSRLLAPIGADMEQIILSRYFPETEIHAACTTRRHFFRDNSARLQRFFLDHQQEWAAKLDLEPPPEQAEAAKDFSLRLVNGVAGSGKTLIALSRALLLAELYPDQRILVLIHNAPIVADIKAKLARTRGALPANLEINTFSAWAHRQWRNIHRRLLKLPGTAREVEELIAHYRSRWPELGQTESQLREELDFINESLIADAEQYAAANRAGRGFALRPKERTAVWALFQAVTAALNKRGLRLWSAVPREICLATDHERLEQYDHVLIDEAQFFAPSWFQAVRLAMREQSSLFLCADPNQGFMKNRLSWKRVGLDVSGRTKKLRRSYRTTQAILAAATRILARHAQGDPEDFLVPDLSGMEPGTPPMLIHTDSPQDSIDRLVNELSATIGEGIVAPGDVLVIYGEKVQKTLLYDRLCKRFGKDSVWWLNKDRKEPPAGCGRDYLRLANLETATGLEAGIVFLIGVENLFADAEIPDQDDDERMAAREEQARKLYMAMTRAGLHLILLSSQGLPAGIEEAFQILGADAMQVQSRAQGEERRGAIMADRPLKNIGGGNAAYEFAAFEGGVIGRGNC